jgi:hypothetical protein
MQAKKTPSPIIHPNATRTGHNPQKAGPSPGNVQRPGTRSVLGWPQTSARAEVPCVLPAWSGSRTREALRGISCRLPERKADGCTQRRRACSAWMKETCPRETPGPTPVSQLHRGAAVTEVEPPCAIDNHDLVNWRASLRFLHFMPPGSRQVVFYIRCIAQLRDGETHTASSGSDLWPGGE